MALLGVTDWVLGMSGCRELVRVRSNFFLDTHSLSCFDLGLVYLIEILKSQGQGVCRVIVLFTQYTV